MRVAVVVCALALVAAVAAVPVAHHRVAGKAEAAGVLQEAETATATATVTPPELSASFHTQYSIYALNLQSNHLPDVVSMIDRASRLFDGEAWQNTNADGTITIKTVTTPSLIGRVLTAPMTQTWVKDHGWTEKSGKCTADSVNSQLVIPGTILKTSGVFRETINIKPIHKQDVPKAQADGTYRVDQWDATLPNGEGSVTYYLLHGVVPATPIISHYSLKNKPAVWAQYNTFQPGTNPDAVYAPAKGCEEAAAQARSAPAFTSNAAATAAAPVAPKKKF